MLSNLDTKYPGGVWAVDFEFHPAHGKEGNLPVSLCMVAHELITGQTIRMWKDDLEKCTTAPFPTDDSALFFAFYASAEIGCFIALGWPTPSNVLDLYVEFRCKTNGLTMRHGKGLIGALLFHGLDEPSADHKKTMRDLVLRGSQGYVWTNEQISAILDYCESDVQALARLFPAMLAGIDCPRALLRGQYTVAAARMEHNGVPIDYVTLLQLKENWSRIQASLVAAIGSQYGVYDGLTFKMDRFEQFLIDNKIAWPRLASGRLDLKDDTFKEMTRVHPQLSPLRELRSALSQLRLSEVAVGEDGRNRCMLSIFSSTTGRNQPSTSKFIFGLSAWLRRLIKPPPGYGIGYVDWKQQEFGIAAALSCDVKMKEAYRTGDPYLAFAIQAGAAPPEATKNSHPLVREQFKACVLGVQFGMGPESLALRINQPVARARELLDLHKRTYKRYWQWSDGILNHAILVGKLWTTFGWQIFTGDHPNPRSLCNFPMQSNGVEMLRLVCIQLTQAGIKVCAPVHDAILVEAPLELLDEVVAKTQDVMREMSAVVLAGFALESDAKVVRYPDRYMDERGEAMWNLVMNQLGKTGKYVAIEEVKNEIR